MMKKPINAINEIKNYLNFTATNLYLKLELII